LPEFDHTKRIGEQDDVQLHILPHAALTLLLKASAVRPQIDPAPSRRKQLIANLAETEIGSNEP
jgi:hypothetical protein